MKKCCSFMLQMLMTFLCLAHAATLCAQEPQKALTPSQELTELFQADQRERENFTKLKQEEMLSLSERDRARRKRVSELLNAGSLHSADDYYCAAMIFQHGEKPDDYLTAHVLATVAGFKGHPAARWLSAASLDRYLISMQSLQIFNTQFIIDGKGKWQLRPHNKLIPDDVLKEYGTKTLEETEEFLKERNEERPEVNR